MALTLLLLLLHFANPIDLGAQSLALIDVDPGNFPEISGSVLLFDNQGNRVTPLQLENLSITENGLPRTITSVSCPDPEEPEPLSIVIVFDRSGSMLTPLPNNQLPLDMVVSGIDAFLQSLDFASPTAVALSAFNDRALLLSDFRTSAPPLRNALVGLPAEGGTQYDPPFLDPLSGAITLLKGRPDTVRRIILFITDGEPEIPPSSGTIIDEARKANVEVWAITIGGRMTSELRTIADRTGGEAWGSIQDSLSLAGIMRRVALITRGISPCRITWQTEVECGPGPVYRDAILTQNSTGLRGFSRYRVPDNDLVTLAVSQKVIYFGKTRFPQVSQSAITITALNGSFEVTEAIFSDPDHFRIESWSGTSPPFTLAEGESRTVQVRFTPRDSTTYSGTLQFAGIPCTSREVLLAGGDRDPGLEQEPLVLQSPVGGESFNACDSVSITWGGVEPDRPVRVQYSIDNGRNWLTITDSATQYELRWLPPAPGNDYRIRISTDAAEQHIVSTLAGGGTLDEDSIFATDAALSFPMGLDTRDHFVYVSENGSHRVRTVDLETGIITTLAGTGTLGNGGDGAPGPMARLNAPTDVFVAGDTIFITEYPRVRAMDTGTGIIESWAGNIFRAYSPDGTHMANLGSLMIPFSVVADSQYIYVSELDSHRIRRIDRTTRIISTVAGGGGTGGFDSDGRPATEAYLLLPRGLALRDSLLYVAEEVGHRVRVINLRSGKIFTVAGNGTIGDNGDGGPARNAQLNGPVDLELWGDTLLIADRYANRIRMVNLRTGIINRFAGVSGSGGFAGDGGPARDAAFDSPSGLARRGDVLYISDRFNNRVRQVTLYRADGIDSSRSPFSVTAPRGEFSQPRISFGTIPTGERKDSVLTTFYCNTGSVPMSIDSVTIAGVNRDDFVLTGGLSDAPIGPGECRTISLAFTPSAEGLREGMLIFYSSCSLPDTLRLTGTGSPACLISSVESVTVDPVVIGIEGEESRDTTFLRLLCNDGSTPLSGSIRMISPDGAYSISGPLTFTLGPGECLDVPISFSPTVTGRSMGLIEYSIDGPCSAGPTLVDGLALRPARLRATSIDLGRFPCPDTEIDTTIEIRNGGDLPLLVEGIVFVENRSGFSFPDPLPDPSDPLVVNPEEVRSVRIRLTSTSAGTKRGRIAISSNDPAGEVEIEITAKFDSVRVAPIETSVVMGRTGGAPWPRDSIVRFVNTGDRTVRLSGADITGDDPASFVPAPGFFPIDLPSGDTLEIPISFVQPDEDRPYRGMIRPIADLPCANPITPTDLVISGSAPLLRADDLTVAPIFCDDVEGIDTTITVVNEGGGVLEIDQIELLDDPEGTLQVLTSTPITIPPGGSVDISIRYSPSDPGSTVARLLFQTNTPSSPEEITVSGVRRQVSFALNPAAVTFDPGSPNPDEERITLTNSGELPITWDLSRVIGPFEVVSITPATAGPGESSEAIIRFVGGGGTEMSGEILVVENICGEGEVVTLRVNDATGIVRLTLPTDSVMVNESISLPVRFESLSGSEPLEGDSVEVEVSFIGTTFFFEGLSNGKVIDRKWDPAAELERLTIAVAFADRRGDTLFRLEGRGLQARFPSTPLRFLNASWSRPAVSVETVDGHLLVLGLCLNDGLHISVRPPTVRAVLPHPVHSSAAIRLDLPDWTSLLVSVVDGSGEVREVYRSDYLGAGEHDIPLDLSRFASGAYTLLIETPYGAVSRQIILIRE